MRRRRNGACMKGLSRWSLPEFGAIVVGLTLSGTVLAAKPEPFTTAEPAPASAGAAEANSTPAVTEEQCRDAVIHDPSADVAYKQYVGVHSLNARGADVGGGNSQLDLPKDFEIDIAINVGDRFGETTSPRPFDSKVSVGKVRVKGSRFFFNGQEAGASGQRPLEHACRAHLRLRR